MDPEVFDTQSLPSSQQFDAWQQWYGPIFDTKPHRPVSEGFAARHLSWRLDGFAFSSVTGPAVDGWRHPVHIRRNPVDHWVVTVTKRGTHKVLIGDVLVEPRPGVPFVQSLADPMASRRSDYDRLQLYLARDDFKEIAALMDAVRDIPLEGPIGTVLTEYLLLIESSLPSLQKREIQGLKDAVRAMVAACVSPTADRVAEAAIPINVSRMGLVRRAIERHLQNPTLGTDMLCRKVGMSRSQLYRLLEGEGGVVRYIQRKRLEVSYSRLSDIMNTASISEIAKDVCFPDATSFSRAFRREFGLSPSDVRAASFGQTLSAPAMRDRPLTISQNFGDLMRYL